MIKYHLFPGMKILFVGINPHPGSYRRGVPHSNNKTFWYLLSDAGLLKETRNYLKNDAQLFALYEHEFSQKYHFGYIDLIAFPSINVSKLTQKDAYEGRLLITEAIKVYKPSVVCFIGKVTYSLFSGSRDFSFGWQRPIGSSKVYAMHYPLRGPASIRIKDLKIVYAAAQKKF